MTIAGLKRRSTTVDLTGTWHAGLTGAMPFMPDLLGGTDTAYGAGTEETCLQLLATLGFGNLMLLAQLSFLECLSGSPVVEMPVMHDTCHFLLQGDICRIICCIIGIAGISHTH